jgi:hypothetical protein
MPSSADADGLPVRATWRPAAVVAALVAAGFALTIWVFYPGILNYDSRYVLGYAREWTFGDWQSPVMTVLWALIDPLDPGSGSMFLLIASVYWLAFAILAWTLARQSLWRAVVLILLALSPPAFFFVGMIWRDVLFGGLWLLAATMVFVVAGSRAKVRVPAQAAAIALLALGVLVRPNAFLAAPILITYLLWPKYLSWRRAAILFVPAMIACFVLMQVVYYGVLGAKREHPLHSVFVFDLGGISHFSKQNQFPDVWTPEQSALITERCYQPVEWNSYWTYEPCDFVMRRLEAAKIFGSPELIGAWYRAVTNHPAAYLRHRATFMWTFLTGTNQTIWTQDLEDSEKTVFPDRAAFTAVRAVNDALVATPLLRAGPWLLVCIVVVAAGWRRRDSAAGAFTLGAGGSAVVYVLTFAAVGVASDFRYAYWAVLAGIAGAVVIWPMNRPRLRDRRPSSAIPPPS